MKIENLIPDYIYFIASEYKITDTNLEKAWADFKYGKFDVLSNRNLKEFFFILIAKRGLRQAINLCEYIISEIRIPRVHKAEYKHEYTLYYLNTIPEDKQIALVIFALVYIENDINLVRNLIRSLVKKKQIAGPRRHKPIGYI